jgi:Rrf2 family protein
MSVSQKCQYALRALYELANRESTEPVRIADIAEVQAIPGRFLEMILAQLKQGGFVTSRRGNEGGYLLARPAGQITVGELIRFVDGSMYPVKCLEERGRGCSLKGDCAFSWVWDKAGRTLDEVYDGITIEVLVQKEREKTTQQVVDFAI